MEIKARRIEDESCVWRKGNSFELFLNGDLFFPRMLEAINSANSFILFEMYLFESGEIAGEFIDKLCLAVKRGVHVFIFLDDFGARLLKNKDKDLLIESGAQLMFYNPLEYGKWRHNLYRNHRKLLIVDGLKAYTGGAGITDEFNPRQNKHLFWHDAMIEIHGPAVADWQQSFKKVWNESATSPLHIPFIEPSSHPCNMSGRVACSGPGHRHEIIRSLINRIRSAKKSIRLASPYFIPTWEICRALRKAARNGVDVCLLLPGPHIDHPAIRHSGRHFYHRLLQSGIRIFEYQPGFIHLKVFLCDNWVSIGSSNLDRWSFRWNLEANQEIADVRFADKIYDMFQKYFTESMEIDFSRWIKRPLRRRLGEYFWGKIMKWLDLFLHVKSFKIKRSFEKHKISRNKNR